MLYQLCMCVMSLCVSVCLCVYVWVWVGVGNSLYLNLSFPIPTRGALVVSACQLVINFWKGTHAGWWLSGHQLLERQ